MRGDPNGICSGQIPGHASAFLVETTSYVVFFPCKLPLLRSGSKCGRIYATIQDGPRALHH